MISTVFIELNCVTGRLKSFKLNDASFLIFDVSAWGKRKILWHFCFTEMWVETLFTDSYI